MKDITFKLFKTLFILFNYVSSFRLFKSNHRQSILLDNHIKLPISSSKEETSKICKIIESKYPSIKMNLDSNSPIDKSLLTILKQSQLIDIINLSIDAAWEGDHFGWSLAYFVIKQINFKLNADLKSKFIKLSVVLKRQDDLIEIIPVLFETPLPNILSLENLMRLYINTNPSICIDLFNLYNNNNSNNHTNQSSKYQQLIEKDDYQMSSYCFSCYIRAALLILRANKESFDFSSRPQYHHIYHLNSTNDKPNNSSMSQEELQDNILNALTTAKQTDQLSVGLVSTALSACKDFDDWRITLEISNIVKSYISSKNEKIQITNKKQLLVRKNSSSNYTKYSNDFFENGIIPEIVYGQIISNLAQGGAEAQVYQILCEILENNIKINDATLDHVFLNLAKVGGYNILMKINDLLYRHGINLPTKSANSILNACNKANAYGEALSFYFFKMDQTKLDDIGLSVLIKSSDRIGSAKWATILVMQAYQLKKIKMTYSIYERLFAIYLKTESVNLALGFLIYLEELLAGDISFLGYKAQSNELILTVEEWKKDLIQKGPKQFALDYVASFKNYLLGGRPSGNVSSSGGILEDILNIDFQQNFESLLTFKSNPARLSGLYNALISLLSLTRYAQEAGKLLKSFQSRGGQATTQMYTSVIYSHKFTLNYKAAELLLEELRVKSLQTSLNDKSINKKKNAYYCQLTIAPFNALLAVYTASKAPIERRKKVLQDLNDLAFVWDKYTYTALFLHLSDRLEIIDLWYHLAANDKNIIPSYVIIIKVLSACMHAKDYKSAIHVIEYLWKLIDTNTTHDSRSLYKHEASLATTNINPMSLKRLMHDANEDRIYSYVLVTLYQAGKSKECVDVLSRIQARGFEPTVFMYSVVLKLFKDETDWKSAMTLMLKIVLKAKKMDSSILESCISTCFKAKEYNVITKLIEEIPKLTLGKFSINNILFSQYVYASYKLQDPEKAFKALNIMETNKISPNIVSIGQLMSILEISHKYDKIIELFERYISSHIAPSYSDVTLIVDLHGFSKVLARASIRSALRVLMNHKIICGKSTSLTIITGIGKNSKELLEPILKPSIKSFLEALDPPLYAEELTENPGRLIVSKDNIDHFINSQETEILYTC